MTEDDLVKLFTQTLLEEQEDTSSAEVIEEGFFDRMKVRIKSAKANLKNKLAHVGGKLGVFDKEGVTNADKVYIEVLGEELDKIYRPRFEKLFKKYFKDSSILMGSIVEEHGVDKKLANQIWERMSSPQVMDQVYISVKLTLLEAVKEEANASGLNLTSI